jgi:hypothetical protein
MSPQLASMCPLCGSRRERRAGRSRVHGIIEHPAMAAAVFLARSEERASTTCPLRIGRHLFVTQATPPVLLAEGKALRIIAGCCACGGAAKGDAGQSERKSGCGDRQETTSIADHGAFFLQVLLAIHSLGHPSRRPERRTADRVSPARRGKRRDSPCRPHPDCVRPCGSSQRCLWPRHSRRPLPS